MIDSVFFCFQMHRSANSWRVRSALCRAVIVVVLGSTAARMPFTGLSLCGFVFTAGACTGLTYRLDSVLFSCCGIGPAGFLRSCVR